MVYLDQSEPGGRSVAIYHTRTDKYTHETVDSLFAFSFASRFSDSGNKMVQKLSSSDLPQLLLWLEKYLPQSFKLHGELKNHLAGKFPDLDFYVDRWPDPEAVTARVDSTGGKLKSRDFYKNVVLGVFGVTDEALTALLKDKSLPMDWSKSAVFCAVGNSHWSAMKALSQEMGKSVEVNPCFVMKATPQDLTPIPVPEGMKIQPISEDYVQIVDSTWKFSGENTEVFIRQLVEQHPSIVLTTDSGQHVGHMMGQSYGGMGMLYIQPEFRRKGYAKVIVSQLAQKYFDMGENAYVVIEADNSASINLHQSLNIKAVPNFQIAWMIYTPKGCCKCKCAEKKCCM